MSKVIKYNGNKYLFNRSKTERFWLFISTGPSIYKLVNRFEDAKGMMDYIYGKNKPSRRVPKTMLQLHRPD